MGRGEVMNDSVKGAAQSKMVWLGMALAVFGFMQSQSAALQAFIPEKYLGLVNMVFGLAVVVLRFYTTTSLAEKANG
jgi:hypothetical protein